MPITLPQPMKKLLEAKAYGHVVTFNRRASRSSRWCGWTWTAKRSPSTLRRGETSRRTWPRSPHHVSVQDRDDPQAYAVFHGTARVTETGADDHIDKLAKRFLNADKYPFRQPGRSD